MGKVLVFHLHPGAGNPLHALEHVEAALAPVALEGIGRVGDLLELPQHELRDDQGALEEARLAEIHDAPVDDDGRVEDLEGLAPSCRLREELRRHVLELVALGESYRGSQIREEQTEEAPTERARLGGDGAHGRAQPESQAEAENAAHRSPKDAIDGNLPRLPLEEDGEHAEEEARAAEPVAGRVKAE